MCDGITYSKAFGAAKKKCFQTLQHMTVVKGSQLDFGKLRGRF